MKQLLFALLLSLCTVQAAPPKPFVTGMKNPESVCIGADGRTYISAIGEFGKDGDGEILVLKNGKPETFTKDLDDPKGLVAFQQFLFVTDKDKVYRIDRTGKATVLAAAAAFPIKPRFLNDIEVDIESGMLYVSDSGDLEGKEGAVFRITPQGKVSLLIDGQKSESVKTPNGLLMDGQSHLLVLDFTSGELNRLRLADATLTKIADGFIGGDGLMWDKVGRLFITSWKTGKVWGIARPGAKPVLIAEGFESAADLCFDAANNRLLIPDMKAGTLTALPTTIAGFEVDESPLALKTEVAFPDLEWTGWKFEDKGKVVPLRPIVLTHAGDGSNRVFVATQHGQIHVFPDDQKAKKTKVFLDMQAKVFYHDNENEQGFLGLTFHPQYKKNGEFFVFYTDKKKKTENVLSRFKVSKDDPDKADPDSEEELFRIARPYWNHDGGTVCFGPDGYLYFTLGDGGAANDPHGHGQNMKSVLGKVLRIDVDRKDVGLKYGIPKDNPFVDKKDVRPEIWASGLRNIWRMSFDRATGQLWAGEVGQNLYEEINLIVKGGNYGWNPRESYHPFGPRGAGVRADFIDPIWEYHHDVGKSITGGHVYRGKLMPELQGHYLYADYVTMRHWALKYDNQLKRVVANREIKHPSVPVLSFGEDEKGEVYFLTFTPTGKGIYHYTNAK